MIDMRIREDDRALEALPLRLMIVAIVAAMSIVPATEALNTVSDREFLIRAELQLEKIIASAQRLSMQGPGSVNQIDLDFSSEGRMRLHSLSIGDSIGGVYACSVVLELVSGAQIVRTASSPPAMITTQGNGSLDICSELCTIRMVGWVADGRQYIIAEVI